MSQSFRSSTGTLLNRPSRTSGSMADWTQWVNNLSRYDRDRLYPGMHLDLIPAYEKITAQLGQEQTEVNANEGSQPGKNFPENNAFGSALRQQSTFMVPEANHQALQAAEASAKDEYSEDEEGWHEYTLTNLVSPERRQCTVEEMKDFILRFAYPGQDPSKPVSDGDINMVYEPSGNLPGGLVKTTILGDGLMIKNKTSTLHVFHDGYITRKAFQRGNAWYVTTHGAGNNRNDALAWINETTGPGIFTFVDMQMEAYILTHRRT